MAEIAEITSNGIKVSCTGNDGRAFYQLIDNDLHSQVLTFSINIVSKQISNEYKCFIYDITGNTLISEYVITSIGISSFSFTVPTSVSSGLWIEIAPRTSGDFVEIKSVKLELGTISTLANDIAPDYGEELRKCQRYFVRFGSNSSQVSLTVGSANGANNLFIPIILPTNMRTRPQIAYSNINLYPYEVGGSINVSGLTVNTFSNNIINIEVAIPNSIQYRPYQLRIAAGGYIDISADL